VVTCVPRLVGPAGRAHLESRELAMNPDWRALNHCVRQVADCNLVHASGVVKDLNRGDGVVTTLVSAGKTRGFVHGASIRIQLLHETITEDVVGLVPLGPSGIRVQVVQRRWKSSTDAVIVTMSRWCLW